MIPEAIIKKLNLTSAIDSNESQYAHFEDDPSVRVCDCTWEGIVKIEKTHANKTVTLYYSENYILESDDSVREKIVREVNLTRNL